MLTVVESCAKLAVVKSERLALSMIRLMDEYVCTVHSKDGNVGYTVTQVVDVVCLQIV